MHQIKYNTRLWLVVGENRTEKCISYERFRKYFRKWKYLFLLWRAIQVGCCSMQIFRFFFLTSSLDLIWILFYLFFSVSFHISTISMQGQFICTCIFSNFIFFLASFVKHFRIEISIKYGSQQTKHIFQRQQPTITTKIILIKSDTHLSTLNLNHKRL